MMGWGWGGGLNLLSVFQMREKFESLQTTSAEKKSSILTLFEVR